MPVDYRRINAPEDTVPYSLFTKPTLKTLTQQFNDAIKNDTRKDSRKISEHRKIFLKTGVVSQAKGSTYIEQGETKVIVSVFDPREIPNKPDYSQIGELYCEFKYAPFSCPKRRLHQQDPEEKHYSAIMKQALQSVVCLYEFPNFQVDVYALVLHNDGSALSAAITAAGVALSHAGIPMYDLISSVTIALQQEKQLLDPNAEEEVLCNSPLTSEQEETCNHGIVVLSVLSGHEQISQIYQTGSLGFQDMSRSIELGQKACEDLIPVVQKCLVKHVVRSIHTNTQD